MVSVVVLTDEVVMDRLEQVERILKKLAKSQAKADRQRAKDRAEAKAEAKAEAVEAKAEAKAEAKRLKEERDRQRAEELARDKKRQAEWEKRQAEWEKRQAEWEKRSADLDRKIANVSEQVGGQANIIGEIAEAMTVSDNIVDLVNKFDGISVEYFSFNVRRKYPTKDATGKAIRRQYEADGIADGEKVVVAIEAKASLRRAYVKDFLKNLETFKLAYPDHRHKDLYGAITFVRADDSALELAEKHGLFVIKTSPPDVELVNAKGFKPIKFV